MIGMPFSDGATPGVRRQPHDAILLRARDAHWVECTCGWLSGLYSGEAIALAVHAGHVAAEANGGQS